MTIVLCDAENVLNSRPLTYISEDPDKLIALPPFFLQEIREVGVPDVDYIVSKKFNKRFIYKQKILQDLRLRFRNEYLGQINWPLDKVKKIYPGNDGIVRVVEIKTKNGTFLRPVQRLYPLEGEPGNFLFPGEEPTPSVADGHSTRESPSVPDPVSIKTDHQDPLVP
ncbi:integrase catalytic domain-containing protein [Trichonephila clavipes]|nr:integrase catalytic domain-containing protein [Trichonephila clavipes]